MEEGTFLTAKGCLGASQAAPRMLFLKPHFYASPLSNNMSSMSIFFNEIVNYLIEISFFFLVSFALASYSCSEEYSQNSPTILVIFK